MASNVLMRRAGTTSWCSALGASALAMTTGAASAAVEERVEMPARAAAVTADDPTHEDFSPALGAYSAGIKPEARRRATWAAGLLHDLSRLLELPWSAPHVSVEDEDTIVLNWWQRERQLSLYVTAHQIDYVQSWGPNIHTEMTDGQVNANHSLTDLWFWLVADH